MESLHTIKKIFIAILVLLIWSFLFILISYPFSNGGFTYSYIPTYTLTNGKQTIVFQGMVHIGLKSFYHEVGQEMNYYGDHGYKVMLEGIGTSGIKPLLPDNNGYNEAVNSYKIRYEPYINNYLNIEKEQYSQSKYIYQYLIFDRYRKYDYETIDLTEKKLEEAILISQKKSNLSDNNKSLIKYKNELGNHKNSFESLIQNEKKYIYFRNMNDSFIFDYVNDYMNSIISNFYPSINLDKEITLNTRDLNLFNSIINESNKNIYIAYGYAHFNGLYKLLKSHDKNWEIINKTYKVGFKSK